MGLQTSDDAAVVRLSDDLALVHTVDFFAPVVDDPYHFGGIAAANSMSDVFAMGGTVSFGLNIAGFPDDLDLGILSEIFRGGSDKMVEAGGVIAGGHTVTDQEPKYGISVTGMVDPRRIWTKSGARPGDHLYLTKPLGTGVLTTAAKQDRIGAADLQPAIDQMMRLNLSARDIAVAYPVHAATDITGFGIAGHAWEIAERSRAQLRIDVIRIPVLDHVERLLEDGVAAGGLHRNRDHYTSTDNPVTVDDLAPGWLRHLVFDPQTSGGLLFSIPADSSDAFEEAFEDRGEPLWHVGDVVEGRGVTFVAGSTS